ncbi:MAG: hypothetical protein A2319_01885 [Candidatus Kerfeldbacteria bacterium RIFOXYB2_FULL_38_14]|uniref:Uncharacterized protein n=1 Tax=Candidatus Kerfeldbacteria bacterium RIFOXYB2_FULL_38_14 TaxID=1798547 RepID=A0A1G2BD48_9BACT|nr:MAG: hypothetical protein A2319_01885 [Candidatus Kerfeldbacteria bacterium RIFOXYB2_FULL_38_14]
METMVSFNDDMRYWPIPESAKPEVHEKLKRLDAQLKLLGKDERLEHTVSLYRLWCLGKEEEFLQTFGPCLTARPLACKSAVMLTLTADGNQLRVWHHGYPGTFFSNHTDSGSCGILMTVGGDREGVQHCLKHFLAVTPLAKFRSPEHGSNGPTIYVGGTIR